MCRIVHIDSDVIFSDYVEFFSAPQAVTLDAAMVPMAMRCQYTGTYLLRVFNADGLERPASSSDAHQQQSNLSTDASASSRARNSAQGLFRPANRGASTVASAAAAASTATTTTALHASPALISPPALRTPLQGGTNTSRHQQGSDSDSDSQDDVKVIRDKVIRKRWEAISRPR
jgi:hypothetical protein